MASQPNLSQRRTLLSLVAHHPNGVLVADFAVALGMPDDEGTVTRWLDVLIDEELLMPEKREGVEWYVAVHPDTIGQALAELAEPQPIATASVPVAQLSSAPAGSPATSESPTPGSPVTTPISMPVSQPGGSGLDPDFPGMFDLALPVIISSQMRRPAAMAALRTQAMKNNKTGRAMGAYVRYATDRIDHLIATDVAEYGFPPDEFLAWQRKYRDQPSATPKPALVGPDAEPADGPDGESQEEQETDRGTRRARRSASESAAPARPTPSVGESPSEPTPRERPAAQSPANGPASGGPVLVQLLNDMRGGNLRERGLKLAKSLLTWRRLLLVLVWAVTLRLAFLPDLFPPVGLVLAMIPVAGIPWLAFSLKDRMREKRRFSLGEAALVLVVGGWISLWVARQLIGIVLAMRYSA